MLRRDTNNLLNTRILVRRLLPMIGIGVLANLALSWFFTGKGEHFTWSQFSPYYLGLAALLSLLPWYWHTRRLAIWGRFFGVPIAGRELFRIAVATDVGASVAPQAVGGAPVKIALLVEQGYTPGKATTLTLLSSVEDAVFFALAIPVSLVLTRPWENPMWRQTGDFLQKHGLYIGLGVLLGIALIWYLYRRIKVVAASKSHSGRWRQGLADFKSTVHLIFAKGRKPFLLSLLALSIQWLIRFSILLLVLMALGISNDLLQFFLLQWMVFGAMVLTPTPGGTGGAEAAFLMVFGKILPASAVGAVLMGWRFVSYYFILLAGVVILWFLGTRVRDKGERK